MDFSPPGSSVHGIFQARVLEWGAIAFSVSDLYLWVKLKHLSFLFASSLEKLETFLVVTTGGRGDWYTGWVEPRSEKAMAPHSSTLAWKIPWMEEPGGLQSMGSLTVRHD